MAMCCYLCGDMAALVDKYKMGQKEEGICAVCSMKTKNRRRSLNH